MKSPFRSLAPFLILGFTACGEGTIGDGLVDHATTAEPGELSQPPDAGVADEADAEVVTPESPDAAPPLPPEPTGGVALTAVRFGPYVQAPATDRVTLAVETKTAIAVTFELDGRQLASPAGTHHEVTFDGLAPGTRHWYRVLAGGQEGVVHHAITLPAGDQPIRFIVFGDNRGSGSAHTQVANAIAAEAPDFLVNTGDLVLSGADESNWDELFSVSGKLLAEVALISAAGNHEYVETGSTRFAELFTPPSGNVFRADLVYSFDAGDAHFVVLDSNASYSNVEAWLRADVAAARQAGAGRVFVVVHHGPFSCGIRSGDSEVRDILLRVHAETPIDAVFGGHDHIYERGVGQGLRYFVTGGGGAGLYSCTPSSTTQKYAVAYHYLVVSVSGPTVTVTAKKPDGTVIDELSW